MFKPLSLSLSLAVAMASASMSFAGGHHKTYASEQIAPSAQSVVPSAQSIGDGCGAVETCGPVKKKCSFFDKFKPKPKQYTYEWVLKKKKVHGHKAAPVAGCDSCGVTPSAQGYASPQVLGSGQAYGAGQASYGTTQIPATYSVPQGGSEAPAAPVAPATEAPVAPAPPAPTASTGGLQLLPAGY